MKRCKPLNLLLQMARIAALSLVTLGAYAAAVPNTTPPQQCGAGTTYNLMTNMDEDSPGVVVGTVNVSNQLTSDNAAQLAVTITMQNAYLLDKISYALAYDPALLPVNKEGKPKLGKFTSIKEHDAQVATFTIPLADVGGNPPGLGTPVFLALFANVDGVRGDDGHRVWVVGTPFPVAHEHEHDRDSDESRGSYFEFDLQSCVVGALCETVCPGVTAALSLTKFYYFDDVTGLANPLNEACLQSLPGTALIVSGQPTASFAAQFTLQYTPNNATGGVLGINFSNEGRFGVLSSPICNAAVPVGVARDCMGLLLSDVAALPRGNESLVGACPIP